MKIACPGATPWKRVSSWEEGLSSLPEGEWAVTEIVKRDDPENETNDCKTEERNRKGKYKLLAWRNLIFKEVFHSHVLLSAK